MIDDRNLRLYDGRDNLIYVRLFHTANSLENKYIILSGKCKFNFDLFFGVIFIILTKGELDK